MSHPHDGMRADQKRSEEDTHLSALLELQAGLRKRGRVGRGALLRRLHRPPRPGQRGEHAVQPRRGARVGQAAAARRHRLRDCHLHREGLSYAQRSEFGSAHEASAVTFAGFQPSDGCSCRFLVGLTELW